MASAAIVALQIVAVAPHARAGDITCQINGTTATVTLVDVVNGLRVQRIGQDVVFGTPNLGGQSCGTVTTIDTYNIDAEGTANVFFDLNGGPFAPGATAETTGASEIEFTISDVFQDYRFNLFGSNDDDGFAVGQRLLQQGGAFVTGLQVNLNAVLDGSVPDSDVTVRAFPETVESTPRWGDDQFSAQGWGGTFSATEPATFPVALSDGFGSDSYTGGFGDDVMHADVNGEISGGDIFFGGEGRDIIDLEFKGAGSMITLDDVANDGRNCPGLECENDQIGADFEHVIGTSENDRIVGGPGAQTLDGLGGNNVVVGGRGNDALRANVGSDVFRGGKGFDTVTYDGHSPGITVTVDSERNDGLSGEQDDVRPDIEGVVGSRGNDRLVGNGKANSLSGNSGDDILLGGGGNDRLEPSDFGGSQLGSDVLRGGSGTDTVYANGLGGPVDLSIDGVANDEVVGFPERGVDDIRSDVENLVSGPHEDKLTGDADANRLDGSFGNDTLVGLEGNDVLAPGLGLDTVKGGSGKDTASYAGAFAAIVATLVEGTATGDGDDILIAIESLTGSDFGDRLTGSGAENVLAGGRGADKLFGRGADDRLLGGPGADTLNGGPGTDTCKQGPGTGSQSNCES